MLLVAQPSKLGCRGAVGLTSPFPGPLPKRPVFFPPLTVRSGDSRAIPRLLRRFDRSSQWRWWRRRGFGRIGGGSAFPVAVVSFAPVLLLSRVGGGDGAGGGAGNDDGILDGDIGGVSWRLVPIIAPMVVVFHGKLSRSRRRLLYRRLGLAVPLRFSGDGGGDGVVSGEDRRRIGLLQVDLGVGIFGGASFGPSARSVPPGGVGLRLPVGRFAYQLTEKPGWIESHLPWWFCFPSGSSSSGGLGALIPVASDPSVSDDAFLPGRSSFTKQVGFDVLHKTATKIYVASPERRSASASVFRPPVARKTGRLQGPRCNCFSVQRCSCIFWVVTTKIFI